MRSASGKLGGGSCWEMFHGDQGFDLGVFEAKAYRLR